MCIVRIPLMLGNLIRVDITEPIGTPYGDDGTVYSLNHGKPTGRINTSSPVSGVLIMGIANPVHHFDGRVIARLRFLDNGDVKLIASPKSKRFINCDILPFIKFITKGRKYVLDCFYERSCGAVIFREINNTTRFLLIKNLRSSNWGFPKGHMELGEAPEDTAKREVFEETGIRVSIIPGFSSKSEYTIQNKIEKTVIIFAGKTTDTQTKIQKEEIEDYIWLRFEDAYKSLKFENDKSILKSAHDFLVSQNLIKEG